MTHDGPADRADDRPLCTFSRKNCTAIRKMQDDVFRGIKTFNTNSTDIAGASSGYCLGQQSND
jgi:hypothetical protein